MEKYRRVEKEEPPGESPANQIRVTASGRIGAYISYASTILEEENNKDGVILLGLGNAIGKALTVSELLRRSVQGLHQVTELGSVEIKDRWEPLEEGLDAIETVRNVSSISVLLSRQVLDTGAVGYQTPLPLESERLNSLIDALDNTDKRVPGGNSRGRGRRGGRRPTGRPRRPPRQDEGVAVDGEEALEGTDTGPPDDAGDDTEPKGRKPPVRRRGGRKNGGRKVKDAAEETGEASESQPPAEEPAPEASDSKAENNSSQITT